MARSWVKAWREGRGRPVDRGILERSDAISDRFIDGVAEVARGVGGDPRAVVEGVHALPYFRSSKADELAEWLEEEGYLDAREPLDRRAGRARVVAAFGGAVSPERIREVVAWLEAGVGGEGGEARDTDGTME